MMLAKKPLFSSATIASTEYQPTESFQEMIYYILSVVEDTSPAYCI